jgi:hypothetical protein
MVMSSSVPLNSRGTGEGSAAEGSQAAVCRGSPVETAIQRNAPAAAKRSHFRSDEGKPGLLLFSCLRWVLWFRWEEFFIVDVLFNCPFFDELENA